jgi:acetyl esterase/lipase
MQVVPAITLQHMSGYRIVHHILFRTAVLFLRSLHPTSRASAHELLSIPNSKSSSPRTPKSTWEARGTSTTSARIIPKCSTSTPYPRTQQAPIRNAEFTAICGPYGNIPIGVFNPKFRLEKRKVVDVATLIYFHGGGYTVRTVVEVGNGLRILAESDVHIYSVESGLPPE